MTGFEIIFYEKEDKTCPVQLFIDSLNEKMYSKVLRDIDTLEIWGTALREPYSKNLGDGIFELRTKIGSDIARTLYFFTVGRKIILTNSFIKKTQKTPRQEIVKAKKYRLDYLTRKKNEKE